MTDAADAGPSAATPARRALLVLAGLAIGAWSALCGIGGGVFAVPLLHYGFGLSLKRSVGSSLLLVAGSTTSATITELSRGDSALHLAAAGVMIATSFVGARIGFRIGQRLDATKLKLVFVVVLTLVAADLLFGADPRSAESLGDVRALALSPLEYVEIGALRPRGHRGAAARRRRRLVAVPGLLFVLPGLGFLGARATSMAMSLFTSWQSAWLYRRERKVELAIALWLALGAIAGGWIGVTLVHVPEATLLARRMLAATLAFVSVRFAFDVARARRAASNAAR
ncbi:MAG: sulfite exporter TauE/SafE family protein [Planctomycetes bacterium]|nr:sulfite exporter TauE/SafE family protein [Planctomycetota bacterium]